ncbi:MAG: MFS transporter [Alphaproteobacteria bacterium]|nr:MAG: MFS transporter [Alphaproteobacteria bacterium]
MPIFRTVHAGVETPYAWLRLTAAVVLSSIGSVGTWSVPVVLAPVQAAFGVARGDASLPFTLAMIGFALGGVVMGKLTDRFGVLAPVLCGVSALGTGYIAAGFAPNLILFALAHLLIGVGTSATFGPLMADASQWFTRHRGIAVAIVSSGNYIGGAIWPPLLQHLVTAEGWRATHIGIGALCPLLMLLFLPMLRRRAPSDGGAVADALIAAAQRGPELSANALQAVLCVAGVACCVAMAMPQVHIVAYCGDLGYGVARGAEMLSLMLGFGIFSRIGSGFVADRIGGVATLVLGSALQGVALLLYLLFDGLASLYVVSALFGLFQGGIVPMYAIIVRQYFSPQEAGTRLGIVLMATLFGMALGGWMSSALFDMTGSYRAAFVNGLIWNLLNVSIALWLLMRAASGRRADEAALVFARHGGNGRR